MKSAVPAAMRVPLTFQAIGYSEMTPEGSKSSILMSDNSIYLYILPFVTGEKVGKVGNVFPIFI